MDRPAELAAALPASLSHDESATQPAAAATPRPLPLSQPSEQPEASPPTLHQIQLEQLAITNVIPTLPFPSVPSGRYTLSPPSLFHDAVADLSERRLRRNFVRMQMNHFRRNQCRVFSFESCCPRSRRKDSSWKSILRAKSLEICCVGDLFRLKIQALFKGKLGSLFS